MRYTNKEFNLHRLFYKFDFKYNNLIYKFSSIDNSKYSIRLHSNNNNIKLIIYPLIMELFIDIENSNDYKIDKYKNIKNYIVNI